CNLESYETRYLSTWRSGRAGWGRFRKQRHRAWIVHDDGAICRRITGCRRRILRSEFRDAACSSAASPEIYLRGPELSRPRDRIEDGDSKSPHHLQQISERGDWPWRS